MGEMQAKIRILLADDHAVLRSGLRVLLHQEPDFEVVGEAADGREAVDLAAQLVPDIIVMDISMRGMDGIEAAAEIRRLKLPSRLVMLTVHDEEAYLFHVLRLGVSGYVLKSAADSDLMEAIRTAHRGDVFLYPTAVKKLLGAYLKGDAREPQQDASILASREREVLQLTAEGYTNHEIAQKLLISSKTVDTYRQRIMEKLKLQHRSDLVRYAIRTGLLKTGE